MIQKYNNFQQKCLNLLVRECSLFLLIHFVITGKFQLSVLDRISDTLIQNQNYLDFIYNKKDQEMQSVSSTISLITVMSALNPLELAKTRIQTTHQLIATGTLEKPYKGIIDCLKTVNKVEGLRALWKGNSIFLLRFFPSQTLNCFMKNNFRMILPKNVLGNIGSGILGGWISALIFYPIDTIRIYLSTSTSSSKKCFSQLTQNVKAEGPKFLYRGLSNLIVSIAIFRGVFFGFFDTFKNIREQKYWKWFIAYSSGLLAGISVYPVQTIRKRGIIKKSDIEIKNVYKNEGLRGFYRGVCLTPIQSIAGAAILIYFDKN